MKKALICGVSGQDGGYLSKLLIEKGYSVFGSSRDSQANSYSTLNKLGIREKVKTTSMALNDFRSVLQTLNRIRPDEIYNLGGQTSVGLSFEQPVETLESISLGTLNLLEAIRFLEFPVKLYNAGSSECFGDAGDSAANENTIFRPRSPYAVAKSAAYWETANYREAYNIFACSGILFNHESIYRPDRFVTKKIVLAATNIAIGKQDRLVLGNIAIQRDWGWAPEYVEAMWLMLQQKVASDYVIATGRTYSLADFAKFSFLEVGLDWEKYTDCDASILRPTDISIGKADPSKAKTQLGWEAKTFMPDVARLMMASCAA